MQRRFQVSFSFKECCLFPAIDLINNTQRFHKLNYILFTVQWSWLWKTLSKPCGRIWGCNSNPCSQFPLIAWVNYNFLMTLLYIYSLIFVVKNREIFYINKVCYKTNTRHIMDIHTTQVNLALYGKGVYHMAVRIYNALPNTL